MKTSRGLNAFAGVFLVIVCGLRGVAGEIRAEAFAGQPFGVAKIEMDATPQVLPRPLGIEGILVEDAEHRVFYPVIAGPPLGGFFAELVGTAPRLTIYFLFRGPEPLQVTVGTRPPQSLTVVPRSDPRGLERLLRSWWKEYSQPPGLLESKPDYPPLVAQYLRLMLAGRLGLNLAQAETETWEAWFRQKLGLMLSSEQIRLQMMETRFLRPHLFQGPADQPLPRPWDEGPLPGVQVPSEVEIEPLAGYVPVESLYVRFGSFGNFLWLQDTLAQWGGDIQNLVALRSLNYAVSRRIEEQLAVRQSALSRLLGETVVADVAIVGFDLHFHEGAAFGLLFQARNSALFQANLMQQRQERIKSGEAREEKLSILNHPVLYLHSPDGAVRSYYVSRGDFHLVTTSRRLVERFLEASQGQGRLADSAEFRLARALFPPKRQDVAFVYLSREFFRYFTGPSYRIETQRRLQALTDMDLVELALLAAASEGYDLQTVEDLVAAGYLPPGFGARGDGTRTIIDNGIVRDSLRGERGHFVPVADVLVERVTAAEAQVYQQFVNHYAGEWRRLDPVIVAVQRRPAGRNREQIIIDARITPLAKENYESLVARMGLPDKRELAPIPGEIGRFELNLNRGRLFGGLYDVAPPVDIVEGRIVPTGRIRDILIGYLGTTGELGLLGRWNRTFSTRPDPNGYSRGLFGLWRREIEGMTVFSFQPDVLAAVTSQLRWQEAEREAHFRVFVGDLSEARITPLLNRFVYWRTMQTSLGNLRFLRDLEQQLHVPGKECKRVAEFLFDAELRCPLGGEYVYEPDEYGIPRWTSTSFPGDLETGGKTASGAVGPSDRPLRSALDVLRGRMRVGQNRGLPADSPAAGTDHIPSPTGDRAATGPRATGENTPNSPTHRESPTDRAPGDNFLAPPLNWFRGLEGNALVIPEGITAHLEILMELPQKR